MASPITVSSRGFIELIDAALVTASSDKEDPVMHCVYLYTSQIDHPEAGTQNVLVAVTGDSVVAGQTTVEIEGQLPDPILVDFKGNPWVKTMIRNAMTQMKKLEGSSVTSEVQLSHDKTGLGGGTLHIQTTTDGVPGVADINGNLPLADVSEYPITDVMNDIEGRDYRTVRTEEGEELPDHLVIGFSAAQNELMRGIGKVIGDPVLMYPRGHSAARRTLTCGPNWRGTAPGHAFSTEVVPDPVVELVPVPSDDEN